MKSDIRLKGLEGTWYVIDERPGLYLLESEIYGDERPCVITDDKFNVILPNVHNGWFDYEEYLLNKEE